MIAGVVIAVGECKINRPLVHRNRNMNIGLTLLRRGGSFFKTLQFVCYISQLVRYTAIGTRKQEESAFRKL